VGTRKEGQVNRATKARDMEGPPAIKHGPAKKKKAKRMGGVKKNPSSSGRKTRGGWSSTIPQHVEGADSNNRWETPRGGGLGLLPQTKQKNRHEEGKGGKLRRKNETKDHRSGEGVFPKKKGKQSGKKG